MATKLNVYDLSRKKTAVLENAFGITEEHHLNNIYSLSFSIPATDPKVQYILPRHFVRYGETGELYRIIKPDVKESDTSIITYTCEHVITTLCDKTMFGSFTYGGTDIHTREVIEWILQQQIEQNWVLDECDFDVQYEYLWEQENLLNALYSVPKEFVNNYKWVFDTTVYPWKVSLKTIDTEIYPKFYLRAKKNLLASGTSQNYADICTRLYPLGYGEGINQLTIKDANGGVPYLQAPDEVVEQYGIIEKVLVDRSFENAESLKAYAQTILDGLQTPGMSRNFDVTDLYPITNDDLDKAEVGKIAKFTEDGSIAYITKTTRRLDEAGNLQIELSTKATDIVSTIADLADRVRIESVYAQGATQIYQHSKDANAAPDNGMTISLYFPSEMRQINKVLLRIIFRPFRSYSQTTTVTQVVEQTSSEGGGTIGTSTSSSTLSGSVTSGPSSTETTESGGLGSDIETSSSVVNGKTANIPITIGDVNTDDDGNMPSTGDTTINISGGRTSGPLTEGDNDNSYTDSAEVSISGNTNDTTVSEGFYTSGPLTENDQSKTSTGGSTADAWIAWAGWHSHGVGVSAQTELTAIPYPHSNPYWHRHNYSFSVNTNDGGGHNHGIEQNNHSHDMSHYHYGSFSGNHNHWFSGSSWHSHGMNHYHNLTITGGGAHSHTIGSHTHSNIPHLHYLDCDGHTHSISKIKFAHTHGMNHTHTFELSGAGSHSHTVTIPAHSHTVTIPAHSHDIVPGIFESNNTITSCYIYVDGVYMYRYHANGANLIGRTASSDITNILLSNGTIPRNKWITVRLIPDNLCYIVSSVFVQGFVQSRGGGNY